MFGGIGTTEIILIVLVVILLFGADKIPELARGLSRGMTEFKKASDSIKKEIDQTKRDFSAAPKRDNINTEVKQKVGEDKKAEKKRNETEQKSTSNS